MRPNYNDDDYLATHTDSYDDNNDQFIAVQNHKVSNYFLGGIDKTSTYSGIVLYLEHNGVHPTAVNIFRYRRDDKLAAWVNTPLKLHNL